MAHMGSTNRRIILCNTISTRTEFPNEKKAGAFTIESVKECGSSLVIHKLSYAAALYCLLAVALFIVLREP